MSDRPRPTKIFSADKLRVEVYPDRTQLGISAAAAAADATRLLLNIEGREVNIIFAAAPSQDEFLNHFSSTPGIDWSRVNAFHMDEYLGIAIGSPQSFSGFLDNRIFSKLPFRSINLLNGNAEDHRKECQRYTDLLREYPVDIVCMGIGENTHLAFNDPFIADFHDPLAVKIVALDTACRQQQVNDGCFPYLDAVPTHALTLTIPSLLAAASVFCMVPAKSKALAIRKTIYNPQSVEFPSTILRSHNNAVLFLDRDSSSML